MSETYESDILLWSEHQAELLRRVARGEPVNEAPDWGNIIDEVESVGRSEVDAVESLLRMVLAHILKERAWPNSPYVSGWRKESLLFRRQARRKYRPSMRQKIDLAELYGDALLMLPETVDGQPPLPVPEACPVTLDELLAE
jgi:hypothetical protein